MSNRNREEDSTGGITSETINIVPVRNSQKLEERKTSLGPPESFRKALSSGIAWSEAGDISQSLSSLYGDKSLARRGDKSPGQLVSGIPLRRPEKPLF